MIRHQNTQDLSELLTQISAVIASHHDVFARSFGESLTKSRVELDWARIIDLNSRLNTFFPGDIDATPQGIEGVKLRKSQQIMAFKRYITTNNSQHIHDWCCGKGHLGRHITHNLSALRTGYEINPVLLQEAARLDQLRDQRAIYQQADALTLPVTLEANDHFVALHACGGLHRALIDQFLAQKTGSLSLSPCCYHKLLDKPYRAFSSIGRSAPFDLSDNLLKFATRQRVTGSSTEEHHREVIRSYRLGFDSWVRESLGRTHYTAVPSTPYSTANASFSAFCKWAANQRVPELKEIDVPEKYLNIGIERLQQEVEFERKIAPMRSLVEAWLVLDMAVALVEHEFQVSVIKFCQPNVSPRNFLIQATSRPSIH